MIRERLRGLSPLWATQRPTRVERWAIIGVIAAALVASFVLGILDGFDEPAAFTFEVLLTAAFVPTIRSAPVTAAALLLLMAVSPLVDAQQIALLALAVGCLVVVRYCSTWAQAGYLVIFLAAAAAVHRFDQRPDSIATFSAVLMVAAAASATGIVLRAIVTRARRVRDELIDARRMNAQLVQEERQRIADDLHDVVAHDLTVIAMHARILDRTDDPRERESSQAAILASARQALFDLRRVVNLAVEPPEESRAAVAGSIAVAIEDFRAELSPAGYDVQVEAEASASDDLDRLTVSALERIIREAATNVLKHAPAPAAVALRLRRVDETVTLRIWNSLDPSRRAAPLPGGGYGTARMRERAGLLGGAFEAGPSNDGWLLEASFPVG